MPDSPNLTEIATTTLRNRSDTMPSSSTRQAKTMSAIAHGWKPKGKVADIPVKVAKEFHVADAGKKYGHKKASAVGKGESKGAVDRSSHYEGNPGFPGSVPLATSHIFKGGSTHASGYGHGVGQRSGHSRLSGHSGAHRLGKR